MEKFCGNCGSKWDDDARVCGNCGTPLEERITDSSSTKFVNSEGQKKITRIIYAVIGLLIIVFATKFIVKNLPNFVGAKGMVRQIMQAYEKYDIDALVSLSSDKYFYDDEYSDEEYFKYSVGTGLDSLEFYVGHNYKFSYEVKEIYKVSDRRKEEILDTLEDCYPDFDISIIERIVVAEVNVTAKGEGKSRTSNLEITLSKENGKWKLLYLN